MMDIYFNLHQIITVLSKLIIAGLCGNVLALPFKFSERKNLHVSIVLITLGAALYTLLQTEIGDGARPLGIIIGASAIAAAILMHRDRSEASLPLASTIWLGGGVGIAAGSGWYLIALLVTLTGTWLISRIKVETHS